MACYGRGSWFESSVWQGFSSFSFFISYFLTRKQTCKLEFYVLQIKSCLIKTLLPNNYIPYSLTLLRICLVMRNQNTHENMKHTINKVVEKVIKVSTVFKPVCKQIWVRANSISQPLYD